jgi:hypothetical protein
MGHPDCSRFVIGATVNDDDGPGQFVPVSPESSAADRQILETIFENFAGTTFRADRPAVALARLAGMIARQPSLFFWQIPRAAWSWLRRLAPNRPLSMAWRVMTGKARVHRFAITAHHFMGPEEMATEIGQARIDHCAFQVAIDGELHSMCEVNATGLRENFYAQIARDAEDALDSAA